MIQLFNQFANLGVTHEMPPREAKAIGLMNRICMICIAVFTCLLPLNSLGFRDYAVWISIVSIVIFAYVLYLNSKKYYSFAKHLLSISGIIIVIVVNILFGVVFQGNQLNFLMTLLIPLLIFHNKSTIAKYYLANLFGVIFTILLQKNFFPIVASDDTPPEIVFYINLFVIFFVIGFLLVLNFKKLTWQYEQLYTEKNKELHSANEELSTILEKLRTAQSHLVSSEKMASLGQLTAGIAHEINNPINFIGGNITPLKRDITEVKEALEKYREIRKNGGAASDYEKLDRFLEEVEIDFLYEEIESLMDGIWEGVQRTQEIVKGLRTFSRLDEEDFKDVNLLEGIKSTLTLLHNQTKNRITIHNEFAELPLVECLPGKINQVFMNILTNAIQSIDGKGEIYLSTEVEPYIVKISIRDTGNGMDEYTQSKIFDPFFTTKEIGQGTGLGLAISYGIIQQHHGEIKVESELGKGTIFHIILPINQPKQSLW